MITVVTIFQVEIKYVPIVLSCYASGNSCQTGVLKLAHRNDAKNACVTGFCALHATLASLSLMLRRLRWISQLFSRTRIPSTCAPSLSDFIVALCMHEPARNAYVEEASIHGTCSDKGVQQALRISPSTYYQPCLRPLTIHCRGRRATTDSNCRLVGLQKVRIRDTTTPHSTGSSALFAYASPFLS